MIVVAHGTRLTAEEAIEALAAAYAQVTGAPPREAVLTLLVAQSALETGQWQKIYNFNFGNVKASADYPLIVQLRCSEVENGVETYYLPPDPHCNFRAYETAAAGAADYVRVLKRRPHWWAGLESGDPSAFIDALATPPKYFTANPATYKREATRLFSQFLPLVRARGGNAPAAPPASSDVPTPVPGVPTPGTAPPQPTGAPPSGTAPGPAIPLVPATGPGSPAVPSSSGSASSASSATPSAPSASNATPEPSSTPKADDPFEIEVVLPDAEQSASLFLRFFTWLVSLLTQLFRRSPLGGGPKA